jgi:hypothetical protein
MRRPRVGVIVITVAVVVGIAALALGVWALPRFQQAGIPSEKTVLDRIRDATLAWQYEHPGHCPTIEQLVSDRWLDSEFCRLDRCHCRYTIECTDSTDSTDSDVSVSCADHPARTGTSGASASGS